MGYTDASKEVLMPRETCPVWVGYLLANPLRRLAHNPRKILAPLVRPGMTILDLGPGMATFTLDLARFTGATGRVIAVDIQRGMLAGVERRAAKAGLLHRIETRLADGEGRWAADLEGKVDLAVAFFMVHEVDDLPSFFSTVRSVLAPGGRFFIAEPRFHVPACDFADSVTTAQAAGFEIVDYPKIRGSRAVLFAPL